MKQTLPQRMFTQSFYYFAWVLLRIVRLFGVLPVTVHGREHLPKKGSFAIIANHRSDIVDPISVVVASRQIVSFLAKAELWKSRLPRFLLNALGQVPVERSGNASIALKHAVSGLKAGRIVTFFGPGGSEVGERVGQAWKRGAARAAFEAGCLLVPMALVFTDRVRKPGSSWRSTRLRQRVIVVIGKPLKVNKEEEVVAVTTKLQTWVDQIVQQYDGLAT